MHGAHIQPAGTLRPQGGADAGAHGDHDADGFRGAVPGDGRGAVRRGVARLDGHLPPADGDQPPARPVSGERQRTSGAGGADGGAVGPAGGGGGEGGPRFDGLIPHGGYAWWYVDAISDDQRHGLTIIAFIGSVFSPYYAWARRRGPADPQRFCALNVALYGPGRKRWALTERPSASRDRASLSIGPSDLSWDGNALTIRIAETTVPFPSRLRGTVVVHPAGLTGRTETLDATGRHRWSPIAPVGRVAVSMEQPALRWSGQAYLDSNAGDRPLEDDFIRWDWSRADLPDGAALLYDVERRDGSDRSLALRIDRAGGAAPFAPPPRAALPSTGWRVRRATRADADFRPTVRQTLEDTPFYARSVLDTRLLGQDTIAVHESLSLDRFRNPIVQMMLPFRMPRARR
jgi:carotenoid 1,2-hydratase